jgi:hypothetical protein
MQFSKHTAGMLLASCCTLPHCSRILRLPFNLPVPSKQAYFSGEVLAVVYVGYNIGCCEGRKWFGGGVMACFIFRRVFL